MLMGLIPAHGAYPTVPCAVDRAPAFCFYVGRCTKRNCRLTHPLSWKRSLFLHLSPSLWARTRLLSSSSFATRLSRSTDTRFCASGAHEDVRTTSCRRACSLASPVNAAAEKASSSSSERGSSQHSAACACHARSRARQPQSSTSGADSCAPFPRASYVSPGLAPHTRSPRGCSGVQPRSRG